MKALTITTLTAAVALSGCATYSNIHGSGTVGEVSMATEGVKHIELHGIGEVILAPSPSAAELLISGDHNLLEELVIERQGSRLIIKPKARFYGNWKPTMPLLYQFNHNVQTVDLSGSIDLQAKDVVQDSFYVSIAGSSTVEVDVDVERLAIDVAGSGSIYARGDADDLRMDVSGSGKVYAEKLTGESAQLTGVGSSYMDIGSYQQLDVSAIGSSRVFYLGDPDVSSTAIGSAKVMKAD